ncbi:MAG TPA: bifunctional YncE family protein/alkaline phosphatase family protein [Candidatus Koribacter sp.]|jgi:DNA-binding beta-propeller fold protein YncE
MRAALALAILSLAFASFAEDQPKFTSPLPTGLKLDPVGDVVELGSMPINVIPAPGGDKAVVVLSGWREQGIQVVDLKTGQVTQTLIQDAAFYGAAFSPDGQHLYVSGGNTDILFDYAWKDGTATLANKFVLATKRTEEGTGTSYPAGVAVAPNGKFVYVAENAGDQLAVMNSANGEVAQRFPTAHYPYAIALSPDGHLFVSNWGADTVSEFRVRADGTLAYVGRIEVGRHPSALVMKGSRLYVTLAGSDRIAIVNTRSRTVLGYLRDAAPGAPPEGSTPNGAALSANGRQLFVAEADNNALAVFDLATNKLVGRIPTDWYPTAVAELGKELLVICGKGHGTHSNPDGPVPTKSPFEHPKAYALGQLSGTMRRVPANVTPAQLAGFTERAAVANNWHKAAPARHYPPFKHVLYIIKENRTYDQVLGDIKEGDGDPNLIFFPDGSISPNHHALARRFGLFDRFFVNAEVSGQGHILSTAAYVTNFGEKVVPSGYADKHAGTDAEESNEPERGFIWGLANRAGVTFRDYGEQVAPGWAATQHDLVGDICVDYPPMDLMAQDQKRADVWSAELQGFVRDGNMPQLELMWLPMDHLAGGRPGMCTPRACFADNDLALGRIVQALSHSPYWKDTVIFVVEDDAQAGPDHVDSHRAPFFAISAYNRPGTVHRFANTTDVIAAIEDILGMGRLSKFDYFSRSLADIFSATPDLTPYDPIVPTQDLNEKNPPKSAAARMSEGLDLTTVDRVDDEVYNQLLWFMLKGDAPVPEKRAFAPLQQLQAGY